MTLTAVALSTSVSVSEMSSSLSNPMKAPLERYVVLVLVMVDVFCSDLIDITLFQLAWQCSNQVCGWPPGAWRGTCRSSDDGR